MNKVMKEKVHFLTFIRIHSLLLNSKQTQQQMGFASYKSHYPLSFCVKSISTEANK